MKLRFENIVRRGVDWVALGVFLSTVAMFLTLPIATFHRPANHFRSPEMTRTIERTVSLERATNDACEHITGNLLQRTDLPAIVSQLAVKPLPACQWTVLRVSVRFVVPAKTDFPPSDDPDTSGS